MRDRGLRTRRGVLAGASAGAVAALAGCIATGRGETETATETIDPAEVAAVSVSTVNGDLTVDQVAGETGEVRVEKAAGTEGDLDAIAVDTEIDDGTLRVEVEIDEDETAFLIGPGPKADVEVALPSDVSLSRARSANGDVRVTDVEGDVDVGTTNGGVDVEATDGSVTAETTNGDVTVEVAAGDVSASSTNGNVEILAPETLEATVSLSTTNGEASVEGFEGVEDATDDSSLVLTLGDGTREIEAETTNGDVELKGRSTNENT